MVEVRRRPCPLCRSDGVTYGRGYSRCEPCGLLFFDTIPDPDQVRICYEGKSLLKRIRRRLVARFRTLASMTRLKECRERAQRNLALLRRHVDGSQVAFLDVGCHKGFLVEAALKAGWAVWGIEFAQEHVRPLLNTYPQLRGRVLAGEFGARASELPSGHFDLVSAIDVVEHFLDPVASVAEVARLLKPGGAFVLQTPDIDSVRFRADGIEWEELKPVEHLQIFGAASIERLARAAGFASSSLEPEPFILPESNLVAVLRR